MSYDLTNYFSRAAAFNYVTIAQILLENGACKEAKNIMDLTPFLVSVLHGGIETAEMLLDQGANIMATDSTGNSCLHLAVQHSQKEMVRMLLTHRDKGKFMELRNNELKTVMHLAATRDTTEVNKGSPLLVVGEVTGVRMADCLSARLKTKETPKESFSAAA